MAPNEQWHGPAEPATVRSMRDHVSRFARARGIAGTAVDDIRACVSEAVTNAVLHAFRDGRPPGTITVSASVSSDEIVVSVSDDGMGFAPRADSPGLGFGLPMIAAMASSMAVSMRAGGGTELQMAFDRAAADASSGLALR